MKLTKYYQLKIILIATLLSIDILSHRFYKSLVQVKNLTYEEAEDMILHKSNIEMIAFPTGHTFSILNLPMHLKQSATSLLFNLQKKYQNITDLGTFINLVNSIDTPDLNWISYLNNLDRIRNTNWKISLVKLYSQDPVFFDTYY